MLTTIVNHNEETINFLDNANYKKSKSQFNDLVTIIEGSIHVDGKISISKIAESIAKAKDKSYIY